MLKCVDPGIPHMSEKPDKYLNMTIPGESIVVPNIWLVPLTSLTTQYPQRLLYLSICRFMCHDEDVFQSPMEFNPDRHLHLMNSSAGASKAASRPDDPVNIVFGFGRR